MAQTVFAFFLLFLETVSASSNQLSVPSKTRCACTGDVLTFECTFVGGSHTIWTGTTFDCGNSNNEILLSNRNDGVIKSCSNGAIVGRITAVDDNCFTSQLNVTAAATFNNKTVQCVRSSDEEVIGQSVVTFVSATNPYPPPNVVNLVSINGEQVSFNWTSLSLPCPTIEYIIASDCGVCPPSTGSPTVTCTGFQLPTNLNDIECSFTVNSRVCGITSDLSTAIVLRVPEIPSIEKNVPIYLNDSKELKQLLITLSVLEANTDDVSGTIAFYIITFTSISSQTSLSIDADSGSCDENTCTYTVDVPQDVCTSSSNLSTALSARNRVGQGFPSDIVNIGCTNEFVWLYFNATTSIFTCVFTNELDNSEKFCNIRLTRNGQELPTTVVGRSTNTNARVVSLNFGDIASGTYTFVVSASSSMTSVQIEGNISKGAAGRDNTVAIIVGVVAVVVGFSVLVVVALVVFKCYKTWKYKHVRLPRQDEEADDSVKVERTDAKAKLYLVNEDCKEGDAVMSVGKQDDEVLYYELTDEKEDISDTKELLFLLKEETPRGQSTRVQYSATNYTSVDLLSWVSGQLQLFMFAQDVDSNTLHSKGLIGEGITRQAFEEKYRMFALNKDSSARHLAHGTFVLCVQQTRGHETSHPLLPVPPGYFSVYTVDETTATLGNLYKKEKITMYKTGGRTCLELGRTVRLEDVNNRDIVLMDKNRKLFTGPSARKLLEGKDLDKECEHMRKFVLGKFDEDHKLTPGATVLYEDQNQARFKFRLLDVDEDNVRMSSYVRKKLGWFEKGKFFYEFTQPEDLLYCRKVIKPLDQQLKSAKTLGQEMNASMEVFYKYIPDAPGISVSPPETSEHRTNLVFIHDPTQGSRCLKNGTRLLYICEGAITKPDEYVKP